MQLLNIVCPFVIGDVLQLEPNTWTNRGRSTARTTCIFAGVLALLLGCADSRRLNQGEERAVIPPMTREETLSLLTSAHAGDSEAQVQLGFHYEHGWGVERDPKMAALWYRKAAEQYHPEAFFNLGFLYYNGEGVLQDYVLAHMWFNLGSAYGSEESRNLRGHVEGEMTPRQVAEAQRLAREWATRSSDL